MVIETEEKFFGLNPTPNLMEIPERHFLENGWKTEEAVVSEKTLHCSWDTPSKMAPTNTITNGGSSFDGYSSNSWMGGRVDVGPFKYPGDMKAPSSTDSSLHASWKNKHPEQWMPDEVTLWICSLMRPDTLGFHSTINVQAFLNLTGAELVRMTCKEMQDRDPQNGSYVYTALQNVMSQMSMSFGQTSSYNSPCYTRLESVNPENLNEQNQENQQHNVFRYPGNLMAMDQDAKEAVTQKLSSLNLNLISFDVDDDFASIRSFTDLNGDPLQLKNLSLRAFKLGMAENQPKRLPAVTGPTTQGVSVFTPTPTATPPPLPSPSSASDGSQSPTYATATNELTIQTITALQNTPYSTNYSVEVKGNHLWEFIRDLLFDSRYNPSLVKWEDREEGVFKFVRSDQVAKLWGRKKNNPAMTYEKLSRAMRYYYKRKILERIDGRRLVYKFGSMATGWKV